VHGEKKKTRRSIAQDEEEEKDEEEGKENDKSKGKVGRGKKSYYLEQDDVMFMDDDTPMPPMVEEEEDGEGAPGRSWTLETKEVTLEGKRVCVIGPEATKFRGRGVVEQYGLVGEIAAAMDDVVEQLREQEKGRVLGLVLLGRCWGNAPPALANLWREAYRKPRWTR